VETIAKLGEDFAQVQVMFPAESETVVEEDAAVGNADGLQVDGELFAEWLAKRKVKGSVRLEMIAGDCRVAIGEARGIINVR
jgi:hypothetical protein